MRPTAWLASAVLATSIFPEQVKAPDDTCKAQNDPYHTGFVRFVFESFKESEKQGIVTSFQIKSFTNNVPSLTQFGDSTSIAALKLYTLDELLMTENTRPYLTIVSLSFSDPDRVVDESDRRPRVTSLVLDSLHEKVPDPRLIKIIDTLKICTSKGSCPRFPVF